MKKLSVKKLFSAFFSHIFVSVYYGAFYAFNLDTEGIAFPGFYLIVFILTITIVTYIAYQEQLKREYPFLKVLVVNVLGIFILLSFASLKIPVLTFIPFILLLLMIRYRCKNCIEHDTTSIFSVYYFCNNDNNKISPPTKLDQNFSNEEEAIKYIQTKLNNDILSIAGYCKDADTLISKWEQYRYNNYFIENSNSFSSLNYVKKYAQEIFDIKEKIGEKKYKIVVNSLNKFSIDENRKIMVQHISFDFLEKFINNPIIQIRENKFFYEFTVESKNGDTHSVCFNPIGHQNEEFAIIIKEGTLEEQEETYTNHQRIDYQLLNFNFPNNVFINDICIRYGENEPDKGGYISFYLSNSEDNEMILFQDYLGSHIDGFGLETILHSLKDNNSQKYNEIVEKFPYKLSLLNKEECKKFFLEDN